MENDLTRWMRLVEATGGQTVRVFHGSPESTLTLRNARLFGVRNFGFAASYAIYKGGGKGFVHTLDFHFHRIADRKTCESIADDYGLDISNVRSHVALIDHNHSDFEGDIYDALREYGYDGITGYDFGGRDDFEELIVWGVFNAAKQATWISATPVTKSDKSRNDEPN